MYLWQNDHIFDELKHHNIEIDLFNPLDYENDDRANEKLISYVRKHPCDLFMTCHNEEILHIDTLSEIKKLSIPTLLICFDSLMTPMKHKNIAGMFDLVMISQNDVHGYFKKYNSNSIVSHYAANPYFFKADYNAETANRICFPGTPYGSRAHIINKLVSAGIPVDLYYNRNKQASVSDDKPSGSEFKVISTLMKYPEGRKVIAGAAIEKLRGPQGLITDSENIFLHNGVDLRTSNDIYSGHDLSLSVAIGRSTGNLKKPIQIVHLRNFEIPMCAGVQLCQYFDELAECFEDEKEIIFYRTDEEMIEKARFYLNPANASLRNSIRRNARTRAEAEHTWFCRFNKAFGNLGLKVYE